MPCEIRKSADGKTTVIVCRKERGNRCVTCGVPSTVLCDYPVIRDGVDTTCDRPCCRAHAVRVGPGKDYCLAHARKDRS